MEAPGARSRPWARGQRPPPAVSTRRPYARHTHQASKRAERAPSRPLKPGHDRLPRHTRARTRSGVALRLLLAARRDEAHALPLVTEIGEFPQPPCWHCCLEAGTAGTSRTVMSPRLIVWNSTVRSGHSAGRARIRSSASSPPIGAPSRAPLKKAECRRPCSLDYRSRSGSRPLAHRDP